jgi:hypothetical protein
MLELFFDLVFVFSVTRLTFVVANTHDALGFLEAATFLFVVWWMDDGYCWLSNNISPTATSTRRSEPTKTQRSQGVNARKAKDAPPRPAPTFAQQ